MTEQIQGISEWLKIDQDRINLFADATLDHQFIHTDPERAKDTPFGGTIAHGFLSLSLLPHLMMDQLTEQLAAEAVVNYGINKLRFLSPVSVDSNVRLNWKVVSEAEKGAGKLLTVEAVLEIEGSSKPALMVEWLIFSM